MSLPNINSLLQGIGNDISGKLDVGVSLNQVLGTIQPPPLPPGVGQMVGLLAQNLSTVSSSGNPSELPSTNILNSIQNSIQNLLGNISSQISNAVNSVIGIFSIPQNPQNLSQQFSDLQTQFSSNAQTLQSGISLQLNSQSSNPTTGTQFGQFQNIISQQGSQSNSLSPKKIRDLSTDPETYDQYITDNTQTAAQSVGQAAQSNATDYTSNSVVTNTSQTKGTILNPDPSLPTDQQMTIRRTGYWARPLTDPSVDADSAALNSSTGVGNLREGISCAVDPSVIPYGSKIIFPDIGVRIAMDTGSAVDSNQAAGSSGQSVSTTIDVFYVNKSTSDTQLNALPEVVTVTVQFPRSGVKKVGNNVLAANNYRYNQSADEISMD